MSLHKLTAGDGYTYLTRQVAVGDATDRGTSGLADYYSEKGESPGRWWGSGLDGADLSVGEVVTEAQMKSLFGEGRHPDAGARRTALIAEGATKSDADAGTRLGHPFRIASGETEFANRIARTYAEHDQSIGAKWSDPIDFSTRARMRSRVAEEMFVERYGRQPLDDRERHGFVAEESRHRTSSVAGFDLSFTPVKSVSALWAIADLDTARQIEQAHAAAVQDTLAWLEANVLFTRLGHHGVRQVSTKGLIAAAFTHRDSRAGDPNLHTHVAVSNKVQEGGSGHWLAIDARVLFKANVTLSEHYNTRLEAELGARLGLAFADEPSPRDRGRPVREVAGVDLRITQAWSQRRRAIDGRRAELAHEFHGVHGRPPTPTELIALSQQANLETREAKHEPRAERTQREAWAEDARRVLGSRNEVAKMVARCLSPVHPPRLIEAPSADWITATAARVVRTVEADRATWQTWHLRAEAERQIRYAGLPLAHSSEVVDAVVMCAIERESVVLGDPDPANHPDLETPAALRRDDGSSVYVVHGSQRFTSQRILDAETAILEAAGQCDGRVVSPGRVRSLTQRTDVGANHHELADEQVRLVGRLAGSSPRVQVALAPAGSGKTTCMRALADLWSSDGGKVVGLAPSAAAAHQLGESLSGEAATDGITCETLAKLAWDLANGASSRWADQIDATTLVIIDEAAMAGTLELAAVITHITDRGGTVRLIGDDRQLASVAAGGIVRAIADRYGAATLIETRRFADPVEGAATLALRDGDPLALGYYADHERLHVGDPSTTADKAYEAWRADLAAGRSSVLIAPTREIVSALNGRAQRDLTARKRDATSRSVTLTDGTEIGTGDIVVTRRNDRRLTTTATDWVKNGDRWIVTDVHANDSLRLQDVENARHQVRVPAEYAAHHLTLGYATTIHGAQGLTVDTAHAVLTGAEDRSLVYVAMTRGRLANHAYVSVNPGASPSVLDRPDWHDLVTRPETLAPPTAVEILTAALACTPHSEAATSAADGALTTANVLELLQTAADRYRDALYVAAEAHLGPAASQDLANAVRAHRPEIVDEPSWDALRGHLLLAAIHTGQEPANLLLRALDEQSLAGARDVAAVLTARLTIHHSPTEPASPLPWLPAVPEALAGDPTWRRYLDERSAWITDLAAHAAQSIDAWHAPTDNDVPTWARPFLSSDDPTLVGDLAIWRAVEGIDPADLTATGRRRAPGVAGRHQVALDQRVSELGAGAATQGDLPDAVLADPWLPQLRMRLSELGLSGIDVARTVEASLSEPLPTEVPAAALWWRTQRHQVKAAETEAADEQNEPLDYGPDPRWEINSQTAYQRIVELHRFALDYYADLYSRSWAPKFLADRLYDGWEADLRDLRCGYAPPGPDSLIRHLARSGATDQELVESGLARYREVPGGGSRLIDAFRDRVVFPLYDPRRQDHVVGFVGRRNPTKDDTEYAGPKYLNTRTTAAYAKSDNLFGLEMLSMHPEARPTIVEGPLDALAVTLATEGRAVGLAPLGTALTDAQARLVTDNATPSAQRPLLMFDSDEAGTSAAISAATLFARSDVAAQIVHLPSGLDPCQTLHDDGPEALASTVRLATRDDETSRLQALAIDSSTPQDPRERSSNGPSMRRHR